MVIVHLPSATQNIQYKVIETEHVEAASGCEEHPSFYEERMACARSFRHFLPHWKFKNRESGAVMSFANLWQGQRNAVEQMELHRWLLLLKAGKLGFTELECAYDGWVLLYRQPNARVHILSMNKPSAMELLEWVRFGVTHLPSWLGLPLSVDGNTMTQLTLIGGVDDERKVVSYPAVQNAAIDQTATHTHLDELARMAWPYETWSSVESTVAPGGSVHIVTRGAGDSGAGGAVADIWDKAMTGEIPLHPHFEPWTSRPRYPEGEVPEGADPNEVWYQQRAGSMLPHQLDWLAPRTAEDALRGSSESQFIAEAQWLACAEDGEAGRPDLPILPPGDRTPLVLGVDASVNNDYFACVAVSRHPNRPDDVAVRAIRFWVPQNGQEIPYHEVEDWIRLLCLGGCLEGHPNARDALSSVPGCNSCAMGQRMPAHNVTQIAYDVYQLVDMMQTLSRDRVAWCRKFPQGVDRELADANLRSLIIQKRLAHRNHPDLNQHVKNANAKTSPNEDTKLRIIKRNPAAKIDLLVALSMAASECRRLVMDNAR